MFRRLARHHPSPHPRPSGRCRKRSLRLQTGLPLPIAPPEASAEPRLLCSDLVTVRLTTPGHSPRTVEAILEEISRHTACLQFEEPIPADTAVRFQSVESEEGGNLTGTVVQCLHQPDLGFFGEIRFAPGCTWSPNLYRPLHLFDPAELIAARETAAEA